MVSFQAPVIHHIKRGGQVGLHLLIELYHVKKIHDLESAEVENALHSYFGYCSCVRKAEGHVQTYSNWPIPYQTHEATWDSLLYWLISSTINFIRSAEFFSFSPYVFQAITQDKQDTRNMYECPVYKTRTRGPTYVWTFNLKSKDKPAKWTLAGVALLLQI
jgi:hypothetical protein